MGALLRSSRATLHVSSMRQLVFRRRKSVGGATLGGGDACAPGIDGKARTGHSEFRRPVEHAAVRLASETRRGRRTSIRSGILNAVASLCCVGSVCNISIRHRQRLPARNSPGASGRHGCCPASESRQKVADPLIRRYRLSAAVCVPMLPRRRVQSGGRTRAGAESPESGPAVSTGPRERTDSPERSSIRYSIARSMRRWSAGSGAASRQSKDNRVTRCGSTRAVSAAQWTATKPRPRSPAISTAVSTVSNPSRWQ
jgi:hypothetical protein